MNMKSTPVADSDINASPASPYLITPRCRPPEVTFRVSFSNSDGVEEVSAPTPHQAARDFFWDHDNLPVHTVYEIVVRGPEEGVVRWFDVHNHGSGNEVLIQTRGPAFLDSELAAPLLDYMDGQNGRLIELCTMRDEMNDLIVEIIDAQNQIGNQRRCEATMATAPDRGKH